VRAPVHAGGFFIRLERVRASLNPWMSLLRRSRIHLSSNKDQTVPDFPVSQTVLPSTYSLLRSLNLVRNLRHFQTVGLSRQDGLDDVE
jgi:hypothetical protein